MLMPVVQDVRARAGIDRERDRLHLLGLDRLPVGRGLQLRARPSTRVGAVAAHPGEPRRDGRGLGPVRGLGASSSSGDIDTALVYCFGKSSPGRPPRGARPASSTRTPSARCGPTPISLAALQARALLDAGKATEADFAEVVARSRKNALDNPNAQLAWDRLGRGPAGRDPDDRPAAQARLPADHRRRRRGRAGRRRHGPQPARAAGVDPRHRPPHRAAWRSALRDLTTSRVDPTGRPRRPASATAPVDVAELHAPFSPPGADPARRPRASATTSTSTRRVGALAANPVMAAGLIRIGEVAPADHGRRRPTEAVAHATSGPCLQQNLVCVLEGEG